MMRDRHIVCDTPEQISMFRLLSLKYQLRLESLGMRSSGGAIRPRIAAEFGLPETASHARFIAAVQAKLDAMIESKS